MNDWTLICFFLIGSITGYFVGSVVGYVRGVKIAQRLHADIWQFVADAVGSVGGTSAQGELMARINQRLDDLRRQQPVAKP